MAYHEEYSNWVEVALSAITNNVRLIRQLTGVDVMAIVKANAYGHGAIPVAEAAIRGGAAWLGVARLEEALELRQAGLDCPVLILGYTPQKKYVEAIQSNISLAVWEREQVATASAIAGKSSMLARLHLKVDTGMSRLGIPPSEAILLAQLISETSGVVFEGIFTHYAVADEPQKPATAHQETCFHDVIQTLEKADLRPAYVHAANTAATLTRNSAHFNMVRTGIAIYGLQPSSEVMLPDTFQPALAWKSVLSMVKSLPAGCGVSYGHEYFTHAGERIGTVPVGYADGYRRVRDNLVLVRGKKVPVVGRVCMDQIMVSLDATPEAQTGDEVVLIGEQEGVRISAEDVARIWGTINYEVVCGFSPRVPRVYKQ